MEFFIDYLFDVIISPTFLNRFYTKQFSQKEKEKWAQGRQWDFVCRYVFHDYFKNALYVLAYENLN